MNGFTHFDHEGNAIMVDVHEKADTYRVAIAQGTITVNKVFSALQELRELWLLKKMPN